MYSIYAVVLTGDQKHRRLLGLEADETRAKELARDAACSWADYAVVKDMRGGPPLLIPHPEYRPAGDEEDEVGMTLPCERSP